jgi:hypothetical protein
MTRINLEYEDILEALNERVDFSFATQRSLAMPEAILQYYNYWENNE